MPHVNHCKDTQGNRIACFLPPRIFLEQPACNLLATCCLNNSSSLKLFSSCVKRPHYCSQVITCSFSAGLVQALQIFSIPKTRVMGKEWTRKHKIFLGVTQEQPLPTCLHWPKFNLMADGASALLTSFQSWEMSNGSLQSLCCSHVQDRCGSLGLHRRKPRPTRRHGHRSGKGSWLGLADSITAFPPDPVCYCTLPYMHCCECCAGLCRAL